MMLGAGTSRTPLVFDTIILGTAQSPLAGQLPHLVMRSEISSLDRGRPMRLPQKNVGHLIDRPRKPP